jgi:hypothetical protein
MRRNRVECSGMHWTPAWCGPGQWILSSAVEREAGQVQSPHRGCRLGAECLTLIGNEHPPKGIVRRDFGKPSAVQSSAAECSAKRGVQRNAGEDGRVQGAMSGSAAIAGCGCRPRMPDAQIRMAMGNGMVRCYFRRPPAVQSKAVECSGARWSAMDRGGVWSRSAQLLAGVVGCESRVPKPKCG